MTGNAYSSITVSDLAVRLDAGDCPRLIDVREGYEWKIVHLPAAEHKPLSDIRTWWQELDPGEELAFLCHHGNRSAAVCRALAAEGFTRLWNVEGGIDAWSRDVDSTLPVY